MIRKKDFGSLNISVFFSDRDDFHPTQEEGDLPPSAGHPPHPFPPERRDKRNKGHWNEPKKTPENAQGKGHPCAHDSHESSLSFGVPGVLGRDHLENRKGALVLKEESRSPKKAALWEKG
jgi:hypothetical protein